MMPTQPLPTAVFAFIWHFIQKQRWQFVVLFACISAHIFESNLLPYCLKLIIDKMTQMGVHTTDAYSELALPVSLFMACWIIMVAIFRFQDWLAISTFSCFKTDMRMQLFDYVKQHSHHYFSNHFAGSIAGKINDLPRASMQIIELIRWRVLSSFVITFTALLTLGFVGIIFPLLLGVWVVIHLFINYHFAKKVDCYATIHAQDLNNLQGQIVDVVSNSYLVRLFSHSLYEKSYISQWQKQEKASLEQTSQAMLRARIFMDSPFVLLYGAVLFFLITGWKAGIVTTGDVIFVIFTIYNVLFQLWTLGNELPNLFNEIGTCKQALATLNQPLGIVDKPEAKPLQISKGEIRFDSVCFAYNPSIPLFQDMNIQIQAGEKVGLVGLSGSGKSTFVNLILRLYDIDKGEILIDGQNIADVTQASLHQSIAMIPQDTGLFHRTIRENIRYGNPEADDEAVIAASIQAHCHEFIIQTEEGYDSLVGERGVKLSGGQRQRIAIARAILKNAPILILDEATSALDSITEQYIQKGLDSLMENRTTIVVAHRLSTLTHLNRILVFAKGKIIEDGSHEALIQQNGHYARLWNMQAGGFLPEFIPEAV